MGAEKFGMSLETREIKLFGRDIPGFCRDIPMVPKKFEKKKFVFNFWPLVKVVPFLIPLSMKRGIIGVGPCTPSSVCSWNWRLAARSALLHTFRKERGT